MEEWAGVEDVAPVREAVADMAGAASTVLGSWVVEAPVAEEMVWGPMVMVAAVGAGTKGWVAALATAEETATEALVVAAVMVRPASARRESC